VKPRVIPKLVRIALLLPLLAAGITAVSSTAGVGPAAPLCAQAAFLHRVGLVVEHGDGQVVRRCVGFDTSTATALAVLQASGLEVGEISYGGLGTAICQIDNEPPTYPPGCFTPSGSYWVLFVSHAGGAWVNSAVGASSVSVGDGDAVGFRYDPQSGADPPPASPAGTCPAVTPPPARSPTPRAPAATSAGDARAPAIATSQTPARASTTPTSGVLGLVTPGPSATVRATVASLSGGGEPPGINLGLLLAAIGVGGLAGLLGVRTLQRRRE
jgi:hypothetical protein